MKRTILLLTLALAASAQASPFVQGDPVKGKALHAEHCASCHAGLVGGDGSAVYTRPDHMIKSADALAKRIAFCSAKTGAKLFPEEETDIGAYLNRTYYHFK